MLLSFTTTRVVTEFTKVTVGRPRPGQAFTTWPGQITQCVCSHLELFHVDLIARCLPKAGSVNASPFGLVDASICTQTDIDMLKDGFRSFFSGHSSCTSYPRVLQATGQA